MNMILAIHPKWVQKIRLGEKSFELRKNFPKDINTVYIYETSPVMKITSKFDIDYILKNSPTNIWSQVSDETGLTYNEFFKYYNNKKKAVAIKIKNFSNIIPIKFNGSKLFPSSYIIINSLDDIYILT